MRNKILEDVIVAMKNRDKEKLLVLRMVKGAIQLEEIKTKKELNDDEMITILKREVKTRNESIKEFEKGNRTDLIEKTKEELDILMEYLPKQLTEEEIKFEIDKALKDVELSNLDMGKAMSVLAPIFKGKADLALVNKIIKQMLIK